MSSKKITVIIIISAAIIALGAAVFFGYGSYRTGGRVYAVACKTFIGGTETRIYQPMAAPYREAQCVKRTSYPDRGKKCSADDECASGLCQAEALTPDLKLPSVCADRIEVLDSIYLGETFRL